MTDTEPYYAKLQREAAERLTAELAKPMADEDNPRDGDDEFDPWALFPSLYGSYPSDFDALAIGVLGDILDGTWTRTDLAAEMFREMLCTAELCEYGSSPRVCFPSQQFGPLLPKLIEKWKAYYLLKWATAYSPEIQ